MSEAKFQAFRIDGGERPHSAAVVTIALDDLSDGEVLIAPKYSSVNYKDALAGTGGADILRRYPLIGGIDVAGHVVASRDPSFREGDAVLATGSGLSETRDGGYSQRLRLPAKVTIPLPEGLDLREAMIIGTAGYTAALALWQMERNGQTPEMGPIVVTGATGGVGMLAIDILATAGYEPHAITGKIDALDTLTGLGARQVISRAGLHWGQRSLEAAMFAGAIDNVGGEMLDGLTRVIKPYGNIASCGLAGGAELHSTVMPFIIRGLSLLGVASAGSPLVVRRQIWERLSTTWKPRHLDTIHSRTVDFEGLPDVFSTMLAGKSFGRTLVEIPSN